MLVISDRRLRQRVLGTGGKRAGRHRAAAIGKSRDRRGEILEVGIPPKDLVAAAEAVIDANIELVLVVRFVGDAAEIVGLVGAGGQRVVGEQILGAMPSRKNFLNPLASALTL